MKYISLGTPMANGDSFPSPPQDPSLSRVSITQAILNGLAPDRGLYVPERWPSVDHDRLSPELPFAEFAARLLEPFFEGDPLDQHLQRICTTAFNFPVPQRSLSDGSELLELFHGPTCAFKDFGARFLANCMNAIPKDASSKERMVLVATSGDTGGAVAAAFHDLTEIPVAILYPKNGVTLRQEKQLTTWGEQVQAFAVSGSFDDCQRVVKQALSSADWIRRFQMISANSINLARLLPQMAYFAYASLQYEAKYKKPVTLIIPSGNMGNGSAALWALHLGFPISKIIFAHNANRTVPDFYQTQTWQAHETVSTLANAMDVGSPSNFQRIHQLYGESILKTLTDAVSVNDEDIVQSIRESFRRWNLIACPHTAVGLHVGMKLSQQKNSHWMVAATAHPAKFERILTPILSDEMRAKGLSSEIEVPPQLAALLDRTIVREEIAASLEALTSHWKK